MSAQVNKLFLAFTQEEIYLGDRVAVGYSIRGERIILPFMLMLATSAAGALIRPLRPAARPPSVPRGAG